MICTNCQRAITVEFPDTWTEDAGIVICRRGRCKPLFEKLENGEVTVI